MNRGMIACVLSLTMISSILAFAGEADMAYFKQFLYQKEVDNTDPDFPREQYRLLVNKTFKYLATDGTKVEVDAGLYLHESGAYDLYYREMTPVGQPNPDGSQPMMPRGCKHFKGNWIVPGTDLILNEGIGTRAFFENQNGVQMVFSQDFLMPGLKGKPILFAYGFGTTPMETEDYTCISF